MIDYTDYPKKKRTPNRHGVIKCYYCKEYYKPDDLKWKLSTPVGFPSKFELVCKECFMYHGEIGELTESIFSLWGITDAEWKLK